LEFILEHYVTLGQREENERNSIPLRRKPEFLTTLPTLINVFLLLLPGS
jgi:hypothetical protein